MEKKSTFVNVKKYFLTPEMDCSAWEERQEDQVSQDSLDTSRGTRDPVSVFSSSVHQNNLNPDFPEPHQDCSFTCSIQAKCSEEAGLSTSMLMADLGMWRPNCINKS